jgi:hypothetical protein
MGLRKIFAMLSMNQRGMSIAIHKKKQLLSKELMKVFNSSVGYGPFTGMIFCEDSWWSSSDRGAMLLGIYEQEILNSIMALSSKYKVFIALGAAEGYYSIGTLVSQKFKLSYAFEMSAKGRDVIRKNAKLNNCDNKLLILGEATKDFYKDIPKKDLNASVILIDIEGTEFYLLDSEMFYRLKKSVIFIELHEWIFKDSKEKVAKLMSDARPFFKISTITTTSRDLSKFPELKNYQDSDRWLIASEGRPKLMTWLRLDPK